VSISYDRKFASKELSQNRIWDNVITSRPCNPAGHNYVQFTFDILGTSTFKPKGSCHVGVAVNRFIHSGRCIQSTGYLNPPNPWSWSMHCSGTLYLPGEYRSVQSGFNQDDLIGIYVNQLRGILIFFKNGEQVGPRYHDLRLIRAANEDIPIYPTISLGGDFYKVSLEWHRYKLPEIDWHSDEEVHLPENDVPGINNHVDLCSLIKEEK